MIKKLLINNAHKHASQWLVLAIDIAITLINFFLAYVIRYGITLDFDKSTLIYQIPIIAVISSISFLIVGSYKGVVRHTGLRDAYNLFLAVSIVLAICGGLMLVGRVYYFPEY